MQGTDKLIQGEEKLLKPRESFWKAKKSYCKVRNIAAMLEKFVVVEWCGLARK